MQPTLTYAGFWRRTAALTLDMLILAPISMLMSWAMYLNSSYSLLKPPPITHPLAIFDMLVQQGVVAVIVIAAWLFLRATPGKLALGLTIVDANTGGPITFWQGVVRYLGYIPATLLFGLGIFWVACDARKQGWHDKWAGTVVVHRARTHEAHFPG